MSPRAAVQDAALPAVFNPTSMGAPALPQVNLLPPEVRSKRALGKVKRWLAVGLLVVVVAIGLAFAYFSLSAREAAQDLQAKQDQSARLVAEQAKYAEVTQVKGEISSAEKARSFGFATEVIWQDYIHAIQAVAPAGWTLTQFTTAMPAPGADAAVNADPLAAPSVGTLTFHGRATTVPDVAAWLDALNSIPGFHDATFSSVTVGDDEGQSYFDTQSTVQVDATLFANRFAGQEGTK